MSDNTDFDLIVEVIGEEKALKLAEVFQGSSIYFPKIIFTNKKHESLIADYKAGLSYRQLSQKYEYTENHVRYICHKKRESERETVAQSTLF